MELKKNNFGKRTDFCRKYIDSFRTQSNDYFHKTSIHGLKYFTKPGIFLIERIFWALVLSCAVYGSYYFTKVSYMSYETKPISFTVQTNYLDWNTSFPSIVLCESDNYFMDSVAEFVSKKYPDFMDDFNFQSLVSNLAFTQGKCTGCYKFCKKNKESCRFNFSNLEKEIKVPCELLVKNCKWNNYAFDCCSKMTELQSEKGKCYSLNSRETLLKHPVMFSHIYSGQGELEITVTRPALMYILGPDDFPYHNIHASQEVDLEEPSNCNILVKVQDIENDDSVHYQEIHRRECRYSDENPLSLFSHYSVSACITECRVRHQIKLCNCSHHMLPARYSHCDMNGLECIYQHEELLTLKTSELDAATEGIHCMCDISCTESEYDVVFKNCESVGFGENIRHLRIKMAALPSLRYKRNVIKSSLDLVVCIGSILALFLGASTLSLVEMIMFFCVRPFTIRN